MGSFLDEIAALRRVGVTDSAVMMYPHLQVPLCTLRASFFVVFVLVIILRICVPTHARSCNTAVPAGVARAAAWW
jgi:hypothetical protein